MVPAPLIVKEMIIWFKGKVSTLQPRAIHSSAGNLKVIERQGESDTRRRGVNEGVKVETSQAPNLEIPGAWLVGLKHPHCLALISPWFSPCRHLKALHQLK